MLFVEILFVYFLAGFAFGWYFLLTGYQRILPAAQGTPLFVRIVWLPAAVALWPYLLIKSHNQPTINNPHDT